MENTYAPFVDRMINRYEGGYGWNRKDTGGPTKYGITCYDLAEDMGLKMDSMEHWAPMVQAMTLATAEQIYRKKYATAVRYNELPAGVDTECLDYGVNSGTARPIHVLRAILKVPGSATFDDALMAAVHKQPPSKLIEAISAERLQFMHAIGKGAAWAEFGGGWGSRVADLKAYSLHLAAGGPAPVAPDLTKVATPKVAHGSTTGSAKNVIRTGAGSAGTAVAAHQAGLPPWAIGLVIAGSVAAGVLFVVYQRQKALHLNTVVTPPIVLGAANAV